MWVLLQGNLPEPGLELGSPVSPALQADSLAMSHLVWSVGPVFTWELNKCSWNKFFLLCQEEL